ncbi:hypothetical protein [Faecalibaculum rodentium]|uniref:hypothetical protein n=1 Tax=Faecalibaculum rodentium TaxID=1702221 RepID=UPI0025B77E29|nr:hypothetical protein [Faecalibaculum rodentium]
MEHFSFIASLAALAVSCLTVWGKLTHPVTDNREHIQELKDRHREETQALEARIQRLETKVQNDWDSFAKQETVNGLLLKSQWAIMSHLLDGNHISQLTECRDEAEKLLFKKGGSV